jgi:hypothetical protein
MEISPEDVSDSSEEIKIYNSWQMAVPESTIDEV